MKALTRRLLALAALAFALALLTLNARASTYLLLSQTNTFAAGITNAAKSYTDAHVTAGALTNNATTAAGELVKFTSTDKVSTGPASSADIQAAIGSGVYAPLASPALTGTPTINGQSVETQLTNKVDLTLASDQSMSGRLLTPSLTIGALAVSRGTLTHAGGNVIVDFAATNRYWSCTITGNVTFVLTNAAAGKWANLLIRMPATNCTPTFNLPAGSITNWFGGAPSTLTANTVGALSYYAISSDTNACLAAYAETQ